MAWDFVNPPGKVLGYASLAAASSAGSGDKLSVTIVDPPGDVLISGGALARSTGGAGANVYVRVFDGAAATGTFYTAQYFNHSVANYNCPLTLPPVVVTAWAGSKTFYLNLNNSAGTPTILGLAASASTTLVATLAG